MNKEPVGSRQRTPIPGFSFHFLIAFDKNTGPFFPQDSLVCNTLKLSAYRILPARHTEVAENFLSLISPLQRQFSQKDLPLSGNLL